MSDTITIATRGSQLALWQAEHVKARLVARTPSLTVELLVLKTTGDRIQDRPLSEVGGKGLFVKEIEEALLDGRADLAVHSLKDVPAELPDGLTIGAVPEREDPRDALLVRPGLAASSLATLPPGARVGTSSLRRMSLVRAARPDATVIPLRGNVDTRVRKLESGELDAIVLASAGLKRLGLDRHITAVLPVEEMLPAIGQGALAIECREDDFAVRSKLFALEHHVTRMCVSAERAFLARMGGSCRTPLAAHATIEEERLTLAALVGRPDGSELLRDTIDGEPAAAADLGRTVADRLIARGGARILAES